MKPFKLKIQLKPDGRGVFKDEKHGIDLSVIDNRTSQEIEITSDELASIILANVESGDIEISEKYIEKLKDIVESREKTIVDEIKKITPKPQTLPEKFSLSLAPGEIMWSHESCDFKLNRMTNEFSVDDIDRSKLTRTAIAAIVNGINSGRLLLNQKDTTVDGVVNIDLNEDAVEVRQDYKYLIGVLDSPLSEFKDIISNGTRALDLQAVLAVEKKTRKRSEYIQVLKEAIGVD